MPDDDGYAAHVPSEIGNVHVRPRKYIAAENEMGDKYGQAPLDHIQKQGERADLQPELTAHVHRSRIAAAHLAHVFMLDLGNEQRKIEAADQVGSDSHHDEPIPDLGKLQFHSSLSPLPQPIMPLSLSPRGRSAMRMGVPEKSNERRSTFSKYRLYEKCMSVSSLTKSTNVGGQTDGCEQ